MNTAEVMSRMEEMTNLYLEELQHFSMEDLHLKPGEQEWSLGQMYLHLINSALYMQLRNADNCRTKSGTASADGEKTEVGAAIFSQGSFPPVRIQVPPSPEYTPRNPESKEQITQGLNAVMQRMKEIGETLEEEQAPQHKVLHPRFGALNAEEWFALVEMHYRHHLQQKERLQALLA